MSPCDATYIVAVCRLHFCGHISYTPYNAISDVVQTVNHISSSLITSCESVYADAVNAANFHSATVENVTEMVHHSLDNFKEPLNFLSTTYKQHVYFDTHSLAVKQETIDFGPCHETSRGATGVVYDSFQYVPDESTLRTLPRSESYVHALLKDKSKPGFLLDFQDGQSCRSHPLFGDSGRFSVMLQLFYDGMGTTNPLRGQSVTCNAGVFYYVIKKLPPFFNSCYANVHLLAVCYSEDLKTYGFAPVG